MKVYYPPIVAITMSLVTIPVSAGEVAPPKRPVIVGHRGLFKHAPENTLASFAACLDLRLGLELDVRRSRDGHLVCVHDATVNRTTNGKGNVVDLTLAELKKLDAGLWFDPAFIGRRVPTLEEVFRLLKEHKAGPMLTALDIKVEGVEEDMIGLAKKYGLLNDVVCIGLAINDAAVRRKLRAVDAKTPVAVLAQTAKDLAAALADKDSDWIYVRFVPTKDQVDTMHKEGKRVFIVGPTVAGQEPDNWRLARDAGVDALLTDYPLECRQTWRGGK